jgi:hypothetical protein
MKYLLNNMSYTSECMYSRINCLHVYARECALFGHWPFPTLVNTNTLGITNEIWPNDHWLL